MELLAINSIVYDIHLSAKLSKVVLFILIPKLLNI